MEISSWTLDVVVGSGGRWLAARRARTWQVTWRDTATVCSLSCCYSSAAEKRVGTRSLLLYAQRRDPDT